MRIAVFYPQQGFFIGHAQDWFKYLVRKTSNFLNELNILLENLDALVKQ